MLFYDERIMQRRKNQETRLTGSHVGASLQNYPESQAISAKQVDIKIRVQGKCLYYTTYKLQPNLYQLSIRIKPWFV